MSSPPRKHRDAAQKALEYVRLHIKDRNLAVGEVAQYAGYSPDRFRAIFRSVTGRGLLATIHDIRVQEAKALFSSTALNVSEIAREVGFDNPSAFARTFRRIAGTNPRAFRAAGPAAAAPSPSGTAAAAGLVFHDDFVGGSIASRRETWTGDWHQENGALHGQGADWYALHLSTPLPENFAIQFEILIRPAEGRQVETLDISLRGKSPTEESYCRVRFSPARHGAVVLRVRHRDVLTSDRARLEPDRWHRASLEVNDNRIAVALDGQSVFSYRDIFPPVYPDRSLFVLDVLRGAVSIRKLRLMNLGFLALVPTIRQGDALYSGGLFEQAKDFYLRHLLPDLPAEEETELRFKIGMCLLRQGRLDDCRGWLRSLVPTTDDSHWRQECLLALLQIEAQADRQDAFMAETRRLMRDPSFRDGLRPIVTTYYHALRQAGFLDRALRLAALSMAMERTGPQAGEARARLAQALKALRRHAEAERHLRALDRPPYPDFMRADALISLSDIHLAHRRIPEARAAIAQVRALADAAPHLPGWCDMQEAVCLRTERLFEQSLQSLLATYRRNPNAPYWSAGRGAAELLCSLGRLDEARDLFRQLLLAPSGSARRADLWLPDIMAGRHAEAATTLLSDSRDERTPLTDRGHDAAVAGILMELAGKHEEARQVWGETGRRFPPERCYFWGTLARAFAAGKDDHLESMDLAYTVRSELFYLAGLLIEHRGNAKRANRLFHLSLKEDPTLRWPAMLAERKIESA